MKATLTNKQMEEALESISQLDETGKLGYAIARNTRRLKDAAEEYLKLKAELFQKYGEKQENGILKIDGENFTKYIEEMGDIPDIEHEVEIYQIDADTICERGFTSKEMEPLLWMVKEEL